MVRADEHILKPSSIKRSQSGVIRRSAPSGLLVVPQLGLHDVQSNLHHFDCVPPRLQFGRRRLVLRLGLIAVSCGIGTAVDDLTEFLGLLGCIVNSVSIFVLPNIMYIKVGRRNDPLAHNSEFMSRTVPPVRTLSASKTSCWHVCMSLCACACNCRVPRLCQDSIAKL